MGEETFSDMSVADILNRDFVAVKVDREERPDIDSIYMRAVVAMTRAGGWPLSVFLTPDKEPFFGGTYFPPEDRWGRPGFRKILRTVSEKWNNDSIGLRRFGEDIVVKLKSATELETKGLVGEKALSAARHSLEDYYDRENGGFGTAPKFPQADILCFLLREWERTGDSESLEMAGNTLKQIIRGGIFDHIGGGVHRYSTDSVWLTPHFEKMLYDQAILSSALLNAFQATGDFEFASSAKRIFEYVLRDMTDDRGPFYSAEDADSPDPAAPSRKKEGAFYLFSGEDISGILNRDEKRVFSEYFRIDKKILHAVKGYDPEDKSISNVLNKLYSARALKTRPQLDDKVLVDWNGLMISSLSRGGRVLKQKSYIEAARRAADFILMNMRREDGRLFRRYRDSSAGMEGTLNDHAFFVMGLIDLYETTLEERYIQEASVLADRMEEFFLDRKKGGFFFTAHDSEELVLREKKIQDNVVPSGNSVAVMSFLKLSDILSEEEKRSVAEKTLVAFSGEMDEMPTAYLYMLGALYRQNAIVKRITITGQKTDKMIEEMLEVIYEKYLPNKSITFSPGDKVEAHLCEKGVCGPPIKNAGELRSVLAQ
jgi:uncharacterized protein YyaL (SSP411 family)